MDSDYRLKLSEALSRVLLPLTRLCIRQEVYYADLMKLTRMSYVESAQEHFRLSAEERFRLSEPEGQMSNARISVLTGMNRKTVKNVKDLLKNQNEFSASTQSRAQRVVHGWLKDPEFLDEDNNPLVLPIKNISGGEEVGSFYSLVKRYSGDVTFGAILDQLNHAGVTEQPSENTVSLINNGYIPLQDDMEQIRVIGKSVSDLFDTALHNIEAGENDRRLQREVVYSHIDAELAEECQAMIEENAQELLEKLNTLLAVVRNKSNQNDSKDLIRVGFGVYYIESQMDSNKTNDK